MAGEWIKWTKGLVNKREVILMATRLSLSRDEVAAKLMRVWEWADDNTSDGCARGVTDSFVNSLVGEPHFADAMREAGWLKGSNGAISLPNFCRHNGETAKTRALAAARMQRSRYGVSATKAQPEKKRKEKEDAGASSGPPNKGRPRERDPIWDAVASLWFNNEVAPPDRTRVGRLVREFKAHNATAEEISRRSGAYMAEWPEAAFTPEAVLKHWARFSPNSKPTIKPERQRDAWDDALEQMREVQNAKPERME